MPPLASKRRTPRHPEYADASTWNEYNGLYLVRDWGVHGGMQQQGGDTHVLCRIPITLRYYVLVEKLFRAVAA